MTRLKKFEGIQGRGLHHVVFCSCPADRVMLRDKKRFVFFKISSWLLHLSPSGCSDSPSPSCSVLASGEDLARRWPLSSSHSAELLGDVFLQALQKPAHWVEMSKLVTKKSHLPLGSSCLSKHCLCLVK